MACGWQYLYRIVYDLKPGDVFRFIHRHVAVDAVKAAIRARTKDWSIDNTFDFPKGSFILWSGKDFWLTEFGPFKPTWIWWTQYTVHVEPVAIQVPKRVRLRLWVPPKKKELPAVKPIRTVTIVKAPMSFWEWVEEVFL